MKHPNPRDKHAVLSVRVQSTIGTFYRSCSSSQCVLFQVSADAINRFVFDRDENVIKAVKIEMNTSITD